MLVFLIYLVYVIYASLMYIWLTTNPHEINNHRDINTTSINMIIAFCLLTIVYLPVPTAYCLLSFAYCILPIVYCLICLFAFAYAHDMGPAHGMGIGKCK